MVADQYKNTWEALAQRRGELTSRRADLEAELDDLNNEITHLDQILSHLKPLTGQQNFSGVGDVTGQGITDAIRTVLASACPERMSAVQVFQGLKDKGFNFAKYSHPMASVYKVLSRLKDSQEVEAEEENRRVFYIWKVKDEDIPF